MDKLIEKISRSLTEKQSHKGLLAIVQCSTVKVGAMNAGLFAVLAPLAMLGSYRGMRPNDCPFNPKQYYNCDSPPAGYCQMPDGGFCCGGGVSAHASCTQYCDCNNNCYWSCSCGGYIC